MTDDGTFKLKCAWEQFKQTNDTRLREIERRGAADPLYSEQLHKLGSELDGQKEGLDSAPVDATIADSTGEPVGVSSSLNYDKAFRTYLLKGLEAGLSALNVEADPDGGYVVPPSMSAMIARSLADNSPMRRLASVATIPGESLQLVDDYDQARPMETAERDDIDSPKAANRGIPTHELFAQPKLTQKLFEDPNLDIETWLAAKVSDIFTRKENAAFLSGSGVGQPRGLLTFPAGTGWGHIQQVRSGYAGEVRWDSLINLFYSLEPRYRRRSSFLMNRATVQSLRLIKDRTGAYIWQPGLADGKLDTLFDFPVHTASDMPPASPGSLSIALGDFQAAYQIVDRRGVRVLRDPFTDKPFIKFYSSKRVGGDVVDHAAVKLLKLAA